MFRRHCASPARLKAALSIRAKWHGAPAVGCPVWDVTTTNLDVYRAAGLLIKQHGEDAGFVAADRADELLKAGDAEGLMVWRMIVTAIGALQRGRRDGEPVQ